jgi:general secretion pathway protein D
MLNPMPRRRQGLLLAAASAAVPFMVCAPSIAQVSTDARTVSIELRDARMEEAITALTGKSGVNVVVVPGSYNKVTLNINELPLQRALKAIVEAAGGQIEDADGITYIRPAAAKVEVKAEPKIEAPVVVKRAPMIWTKIDVKYLPPRDLVKLLNNPQGTELFKYDVKMPDMTPKALGGAPAQFATTPGLNPFGPQGANGFSGGPTPEPTLDVAGQRGGFGGGGGMGGMGGGMGGMGGGMGGMGGGRGGAGQGGGANGGLGGGNGGFGQGQNGQGGQLLPDGIRNLISGDGDNSLIVQGEPQAIEELKSIVRFLDVAPKQVMIKAEFVTVNINDAQGFGIDWKISPAGNLDMNIAPTTFNAAPSVTVAYASGNAVAALRAAATKNTSNILQAPMITTSNNQPASISTFLTTTIFINQQVVTAFGSFTQTLPVQIPVQSGLQVQPHINGDGTVSMFLTPQLSSFRVVPGVGSQPSFETSTQFLTTFRRLKTGETMVLGGFITNREDKNETRVPLLSDLPIIGNLFTQKSKSSNGQEILVFITPTILEDPGTSTGGTSL